MESILASKQRSAPQDQLSNGVWPKPEDCAPAKEPKQATPFLTRLFMMVEDPTTNASISWSQTRRTGDPIWAFTVWDNCVLERDVIPLFYKHANFSSFVRQLNQLRTLLFTLCGHCCHPRAHNVRLSDTASASSRVQPGHLATNLSSATAQIFL